MINLLKVFPIKKKKKNTADNIYIMRLFIES